MSDLYMGEDGDLAVSPAGDLAITQTGWRDDVQQAYIRMMTDIGDFLVYPGLGANLSSLYGQPQSPDTGNMGVNLIRGAMDREGRFAGAPYTVKPVPTGPQCQPKGTLVRVPLVPKKDGQKYGQVPTQWREVPIESLEVGDKVVTLKSGWGLVKRGRPITGIHIESHDGPIVVADVAGYSSRYAPHHPCIAVLGNQLAEGNHVVYMMRRGCQYRIGRTVWHRKASGFSHGVVYRSRKEDAEAFWVLSVHETEAEASLAEEIVQVTCGIPAVSFVLNQHYKMDLELFWSKIGDNSARASDCLRSYGLMIEHPLWERDTAARTGNGWTTKVTTAAANLRSGMLMFLAEHAERPREGWRERSSGIPWACWRPVSVSRQWYVGDMISLEVAADRNYFADGILTHNSIRFDVSITSGNREQIILSVEQNLSVS